MLAVRYLALMALVLWLGDLAGGLLGPAGVRPFPSLAYGSAAVLFVSLFVMKFVGPPPAAFVPRAAIVFAMMTLEVYTRLLVDHHTDQERWLMVLTLVPGLSLLYWYVRE